MLSSGIHPKRQGHLEGSGTEEQCESEEQEKKSRAENV